MARLGSIIESVYASGAAAERPKSEDPDMAHSSSKEHPNVLRDDRLEYPSLDGTSSSASFDFSSFDADSNFSSPREGAWSLGERTAFSTNRCSPLGWPLKQGKLQAPPMSAPAKPMMWEEKREKRETDASEVEKMKERFARLLLGEDLSGGSKGVSSALAITNAITNLAASVFRELKLEPLSSDKKEAWRREMEWMLSVTDHIVEFVPTRQSGVDGCIVEVMTHKPRTDLHINLPALRKLDMMLLEYLDGFGITEFWYVDHGLGMDESAPKNSLSRREEKWWIARPSVPPNGLSQEAKKRLLHQKESVNQILKAVMAINAQVLSEIEVPEAYVEALPKNGKSSLGEDLYRYLASDQFSAPEFLQCQCQGLSEHDALEVANRLESAIHTWQRKVHAASKDGKSAWGGLVKDLVGDGDRREVLIGRAASLLMCLKQKFPELRQTQLDTQKIQYNRDVGQAILESYSRVLEWVAFNIVSRIDDVLRMHEMTRSSKPVVVIQVGPTILNLKRRSGVAPDLRLSAEFLSEHESLKGSSSPKFDRPSKPPAIEVNGFSYARRLESGNSLHSPPGRD